MLSSEGMNQRKEIFFFSLYAFPSKGTLGYETGRENWPALVGVLCDAVVGQLVLW